MGTYLKSPVLGTYPYACIKYTVVRNLRDYAKKSYQSPSVARMELLPEVLVQGCESLSAELRSILERSLNGQVFANHKGNIFIKLDKDFWLSFWKDRENFTHIGAVRNALSMLSKENQSNCISGLQTVFLPNLASEKLLEIDETQKIMDIAITEIFLSFLDALDLANAKILFEKVELDSKLNYSSHPCWPKFIEYLVSNNFSDLVFRAILHTKEKLKEIKYFDLCFNALKSLKIRGHCQYAHQVPLYFVHENDFYIKVLCMLLLCRCDRSLQKWLNKKLTKLHSDTDLFSRVLTSFHIRQKTKIMINLYTDRRFRRAENVTEDHFAKFIRFFATNRKYRSQLPNVVLEMRKRNVFCKTKEFLKFFSGRTPAIPAINDRQDADCAGAAILLLACYKGLPVACREYIGVVKNSEYSSKIIDSLASFYPDLIKLAQGGRKHDLDAAISVTAQFSEYRPREFQRYVIAALQTTKKENKVNLETAMTDRLSLNFAQPDLRVFSAFSVFLFRENAEVINNTTSKILEVARTTGIIPPREFILRAIISFTRMKRVSEASGAVILCLDNKLAIPPSLLNEVLALNYNAADMNTISAIVCHREVDLGSLPTNLSHRLLDQAIKFGQTGVCKALVFSRPRFFKDCAYGLGLAALRYFIRRGDFEDARIIHNKFANKGFIKLPEFVELLQETLRHDTVPQNLDFSSLSPYYLPFDFLQNLFHHCFNFGGNLSKQFCIHLLRSSLYDGDFQLASKIVLFATSRSLLFSINDNVGGYLINKWRRY